MKKRIISLCMAIVLITAMSPQIVLTASAETSGTCGGNLTWVLDNSTLTISGTGKMDDFDAFDNIVPWNNYKDSIKTVVVEKGVTSIGSQAFSECKNLSSVSLPEGLTEIGWLAFHVCDSLTSITIPEGVSALDNEPISACKSLTKIEIPSTVTTIDAFDLKSNDDLLYIYVSDDNTNYSDVDGVVYDKAIKTLVCCPVGRNKIDIPESVTDIGKNAFTHCDNLSEIILPEGITHIGEYAFSFLYHPTSVSIPETVQFIEDKAFFGNSQLTYIDVANNNKYYSDIDGVLYDKEQTTLIYCPNTKKSISIPNSVTRIEDIAFEDCSITTIEIPNSVTEIGEEAFSGCNKLETVTIPMSVTQIGQKVFDYCTSLESVSIKGKITELQGLFSNCSNLASIELPDSVRTIGSFTFYDCNKLTNIIIPNSVRLIDEAAFYDCENLTDVYYCGTESDWSNICILPNNDGLKNAVIHLNYRSLSNSFSTVNAGWSFANAAQSFAEEPASHADDYFIPRERYDALYGKSYVDSQDDLFTTEWGGNCAGMSATAILFFLDSLDWPSIDAEYSEEFINPNDFFRTVNLHQKSQSYYPAIGNDTEVTRLIEAYQLYINAIDKSRLVENLDNTYFADGVTEKKTLFGTEYIINHVPNGTYVASMLEEFQEAYEENNPLFIVLQADGFGHGIVARTDLKPEDMGDGWWRVYVYDPNKPYINESVTSTVSGVEAEPKYTFGCNTLIDNGDDIYLELNPSLNQWRYCTSVNSNSADSYIGSSPSGELLWKNYYHDATPENENDDKGERNNAKIPDFFYTIDLNDLSMEDFANPHFDSTSAWIPENDLAIAVDGDTDCSIYASTGELVAIVEDGDAFVLTDSGSYDAYIGWTEDGGSSGGRIYLPNDVYTVYYTFGNVQFLGNDNVLSFSSEGAAELTVDTALNSLQVLAQEDGIAAVKCANVTSIDECSYVDAEGALVAGETFTIAYSDENKVEASTDSKDGEFQLYQKDADQDEPVATKVIKSGSLLWLWIVGGVAVAGVVLFILLKKKKPNA